MDKVMKTAGNFGGYWLKGVKEYKGHEGEPLFQGNVYYKNKKIGFFAMGDWGGPSTLSDITDSDAKQLNNFAALFTGSVLEPETSLMCSIMEAIDRRKQYLRLCRKSVLIKLPKHKEGEFCSWDLVYKGAELATAQAFDKKYGKGNYHIINKELVK